jgi:hypothetical protein
LGNTVKSLSLSLILVLVFVSFTIFLMAKPANAQTIPKPYTPEFTVSIVDRSYTVPITATQTTDPFTGQQVTQTSGGQYVKNQTLDIKIRNPSLTSATLPNGTVANLYYTVRTKGHFSDYWPTSPVDPWTSLTENGDSFTRVFASTSDYTIVTLVIGSTNDIIMGYADIYISAGGQEDFQVKASLGYQYTIYDFLYPTGTAFVSFADSGWSNTQTITNGEASPTSSTPNPTPTPTVPEFSSITIPLLIFVSLFSALLIKRRKL